MTDLTQTQRETLDWILAFMAEHGMPPTVREIGRGFGIKSSSVFQRLQGLERKGFLKRGSLGARSLAITAPSNPHVRSCSNVPLVGRIAAGQPILARGQFSYSSTSIDMVKPELWKTKPGQSVRVWNADGFTSCEGVKVPMRVLRTEETTRKKVHDGLNWAEKTDINTFSWITDLPTSLIPSRLLWDIGHHRWDIEDDLFNVLVNHWAMDHSFHHHPVAIVNFLLIPFTAFVLVESFFKRNLKPQMRFKFTLIALRDVIHAEIVSGRASAVWVSDA